MLILPQRIGRKADVALDERAVEAIGHVAVAGSLVRGKLIDVAMGKIAAEPLPPHLPRERE